MQNHKMEEENNKSVLKRISENLSDYINHIIERHKEEYDIKIKFTEASNILAKRAKKEKLFR